MSEEQHPETSAVPVPAQPSSVRAELVDDLHKSVSRLILDHAQREYEDVCADWRGVDQKAQGTVAIAGVFFGGTFALLQSLDVLPAEGRSWIVLGAVGLFLSIICAIGALLVRRVIVMERSSDFRERAERLLRDYRDEEDAKRRIRELVFERARNYEAASGDIATEIEKKSSWVMRAQLALLVSVSLVFVGILIRFFT